MISKLAGSQHLTPPRSPEGLCSHVRSSGVVPGWKCCRCRSYNGYQRERCRACDHPPCYDTSGELGRQAREFAAAGTDRDKVVKLLEASS